MLDFGESDGQLTVDGWGRNSQWINSVGNPISSFYGYVVDRELSTQYYDSPYIPINGLSEDVIVRDLNGDGLISDEDKTILGDPYPDLIPYPFDQLRIGLQFKAINADAFVQVIVDYLTHNLNYFYPKLVGVVLNRVAPPLHAKLDERSTFVLEGDAFFMGGGPNPKALDAAVRYLMSDVDRIQQVLHKNAPSIGRDVYVTFTGIVPLPDDKTDEDDPVPPKQQPQRPWYIRSKAGKSVKSTKSSKQQQQPHGVRPTSFQQRHKRKFLQGQTWAIGGPRRKKRGYWVKQPKSSKSSGSSQKKRAGVDQYYYTYQPPPVRGGSYR